MIDGRNITKIDLFVDQEKLMVEEIVTVTISQQTAEICIVAILAKMFPSRFSLDKASEVMALTELLKVLGLLTNHK